MDRPLKKISVVIPVYNGEEQLAQTVASLTGELERMPCSWEVIIVDDHSSDNSYRVINDMHSEDSRIRGGRLDRNRGQQNALYAGFTLCSGDYIITMDDDGEHPCSGIPRLLDKADEGWDVVYMVRSRDSRTFPYRAGSFLTDLFFRLSCGKPPQLRIGSFRIMTGDIVRRIIGEGSGFVYISGLIFRHTPDAVMANLTYDEEKKSRSGGSVRFNLAKRILLFFRLFLHYGPFSSLFPFKKKSPYLWESVL